MSLDSWLAQMARTYVEQWRDEIPWGFSDEDAAFDLQAELDAALEDRAMEWLLAIKEGKALGTPLVDFAAEKGK